MFDPATLNAPFYIGKGCRNRVFQHAAGQVPDVEPRENVKSLKLAMIHQIKSRGEKVREMIIRYGLVDRDALLVESVLIDTINRINPAWLQNVVGGHGGSGLMDAIDLSVSLGASPLVTSLPVVIIKIEKRWTRLLERHGAAHLIPMDEIYRAVRGSWKIKIKRAQRADCVLAVARGIVRGVFVATDWEASAENGRNWFKGTVATGDLASFVGKSVSAHFTPGGQNPVRFLNVPSTKQLAQARASDRGQ